MGSTSCASMAPRPNRLKSVIRALPPVGAPATPVPAVDTAPFLNSPPVMMLSSKLVRPFRRRVPTIIIHNRKDSSTAATMPPM